MGCSRCISKKLISEEYGSTKEAHVESGNESDDSDNESTTANFGLNILLADNTEVGKVNSAKAKQDPLVQKGKVIVDANWGLDYLMTGLLKLIVDCITRLQTTKQPINHTIACQMSKT